VIKDRVRQLGGDLAIESGDRGVCLDILIPRRTAPERQKTA
jgi:signal transduction histidine kinase